MLIKKKNISNKYSANILEEQLATITDNFNYQEINFKPIAPKSTPKQQKQVLSIDQEEQIQKLINARKQELLEALELEISQKKQFALAEIESMIDSANNQAQEIINSANQQAQEIEDDLNTQKSIFENDKNVFLNEIETKKQKLFSKECKKLECILMSLIDTLLNSRIWKNQLA